HHEAGVRPLEHPVEPHRHVAQLGLRHRRAGERDGGERRAGAAEELAAGGGSSWHGRGALREKKMSAAARRGRGDGAALGRLTGATARPVAAPACGGNQRFSSHIQARARARLPYKPGRVNVASRRGRSTLRLCGTPATRKASVTFRKEKLTAR